MQDFEKLGAFYLGKRFDTAAGSRSDEAVLYDSKDLTTHAVIIGMTGSGKTGLGIGLIEEAALDHVPVIAIDPKGDLGNLLLTFPKLKADDFQPWIDTRAASDAGQTPEQFAAATAKLWKNGLAEWGQKPERIARLREAAEMSIYTPGSSAGQPVSVLGEMTAPPPELRDDADLYRERLQGMATSLLTLLNIDADPLTSREHILLANVLDHSWQMGKSLSLAELITAVQEPPFASIGVVDLETFYPAKERFALSMQLNNLLAAPGFEAWMQGVPLNMDSLLHTDAGKPRVSIMSIAHLNDNERMFFVTMLLAELIAWMRKQPGSSTLRAILYMDEVFGYMPPVSNPPAKQLLLTLLKQARAYGVGLVLSTQNPVDLDYKGLSNTGTWFIGRMQTKRDKARVRDGLQGADAGGTLDISTLEKTISGLGKRQFLLHNVHENAPVIFQTRWVMSYLAGPLTRDQIRQLSPQRSDAEPAAEPPVPAASPANTSRPSVPPAVRQVFIRPAPPPGADGNLIYYPRAFATGSMAYTSARLGINQKNRFALALEADGRTDLDWADADAMELESGDLLRKPETGAAFADCPAELTSDKNFTRWEKDLKRWLRTDRPLTVYKSAKLKANSEPGESERDFRIRLQHLANEARDGAVGKLRKRYDKKVATQEERLRRAQQAMEREEEQASNQKVDAAISFGTAILGAFLGRKRISTTSASRIGTAARKAGRARSQAADVARAEQTIAAVEQKLADLQTEFQAEVEEIEDAYDAQAEELTAVDVRAKSTDIQVQTIGIGWFPYLGDAEGHLHQAF